MNLAPRFEWVRLAFAAIIIATIIATTVYIRVSIDSANVTQIERMQGTVDKQTQEIQVLYEATKNVNEQSDENRRHLERLAEELKAEEQTP